MCEVRILLQQPLGKGAAQGKGDLGPSQFRGLQSNASHGGGKGLLFAGRRGRLNADLAGREALAPYASLGPPIRRDPGTDFISILMARLRC